MISFGHEKFDLILNIMIGIKRCIDHSFFKPVKLTKENFKEKMKLRNQWLGRSNMMEEGNK
jgi:hypothetical protein